MFMFIWYFKFVLCADGIAVLFCAIVFRFMICVLCSSTGIVIVHDSCIRCMCCGFCGAIAVVSCSRIVSLMCVKLVCCVYCLLSVGGCRFVLRLASCVISLLCLFIVTVRAAFHFRYSHVLCDVDWHVWPRCCHALL